MTVDPDDPFLAGVDARLQKTDEQRQTIEHVCLRVSDNSPSYARQKTKNEKQLTWRWLSSGDGQVDAMFVDLPARRMPHSGRYCMAAQNAAYLFFRGRLFDAQLRSAAVDELCHTSGFIHLAQTFKQITTIATHGRSYRRANLLKTYANTTGSPLSDGMTPTAQTTVIIPCTHTRPIILSPALFAFTQCAQTSTTCIACMPLVALTH